VKLFVISDQKKITDHFSAIKRSRKNSIELLPRKEYRSRLKDETETCLVYYDISQQEEKAYGKELRFLLKMPHVCAAVIDSKDAMEDPALFFRQGGVDYLGKKLFQRGFQTKRLKEIEDFLGTSIGSAAATKPGTCPDPLSFPQECIIPGGEWKHVEQGKNYLFCMLFAELDSTSEWKRSSGQDHLKAVKDKFQGFIRKNFEQINGRIWMWNEFGGLVLFPYNGSSFPMVLAACKLMMNRAIASCEDFPFGTPISYRLGIHIGETVYKERGNTGTIVSDAINFIFHLGTKYAVPGNLYITRQVYETTHPGLKELFLEEGEFEGKKIFRMRRVL